jgi:hypothetical protein
MRRLNLIAPLSQIEGNMVINPKNTNTPPDRYCQKVWGISIKIVATFSARVKSITEIVNDRAIIYGLVFDLVSEIELQIITGSRGRTHGANTVINPAMKEMSRNSIF